MELCRTSQDKFIMPPYTAKMVIMGEKYPEETLETICIPDEAKTDGSLDTVLTLHIPANVNPIIMRRR